MSQPSSRAALARSRKCRRRLAPIQVVEDDDRRRTSQVTKPATTTAATTSNRPVLPITASSGSPSTRPAAIVRIAPMAREPEPKVPTDLREALAANAAAKATWKDVTAVARRDWIHWITSGKKAEPRVKRIDVAIDKLACGNRRACCFDRSGKYSKGNMGPPEAAD